MPGIGADLAEKLRELAAEQLRQEAPSAIDVPNARELRDLRPLLARTM